MVSTKHCDLAIAGGGLAGGMIALALAMRRPELRVVLVDQGETIGGEGHIWAFRHDDVADAHRWLLAPLVGHGWRGYDIALPGRRRRFGTPVYAVHAERLDEAVRRAMPAHTILTGRKIVAANKTTLLIDGGDRVQAKAVIDARGAGDLKRLDTAWRTCVAETLRLTEPHGLERPIWVDATIDQSAGPRHLRILPLDADIVRIEDVALADTPEADGEASGARIAEYAAAKGWTVAETQRSEAGALPLALGGDFDAYWQSGAKDVAKAGLRAGLFHPATGLSLPDAVRTAAFVAHLGNPGSRTVHEAMRNFAHESWDARRPYRLFARMLMQAADADRRAARFRRFHEGRRTMIERFHAMRSTRADRWRLIARCRLPLGQMLAAMRDGNSGHAGGRA
ncbi:lycopene beta-cyclase CrtY [Sphingomonas fennica]|uniref:Lycopene cyclase n=1 Tax=Edaphosphingomonas fennica TaxID=114404 RepID=A0A2T4I7X9_9SPHN|nr:lycopene beta-cyclase CrtY [Sphingomonas fennica]PTD27573.1 lycopene cyclase [Sphingomonas fennica]